MRKILLLLSFFSVTPALLLFSALFLVFLTFEQIGSKGLTFFPHAPKAVAYAALPDNINVVTSDIGIADVRVGKVLNFLQIYHSPLESYAPSLVSTSDKYNIDYRWLPAIAMQESGGCQKVIGDSHNCWGYGIYTHHLTSFTSYDEAIDTVGRYLAKNKQNGLDTLDKLSAIYNPSNFNDWKGKVNLFLSQM